MMNPSPKRARREKTLIRVCDHFTRTEAGVICPVIKAEQSVRVLYKLQEESLREVIAKAGDTFGLSVLKTELVSPASSTEIEGNLFIEFIGPPLSDYRRLEESLQSQLTTTLNVKFIEVQNVPDRSQIIPQPIISEFDFEMCKMKLCSIELDKISEDSPDRADLFIAADNMKSELEELRENYTKFAVLSQNGKGKSYILNLLMLMTADNEEEYLKNNKDLKVPQNFPDNTLLENLTDADHMKLPDVVKDFIKPVEDKKKDFKTLMKPVCHPLPHVTNIEASLKSLSNIDSYFLHKRRLDIDPYFLPQKEITGNYESTTKCIIHLRYGTLYQMKVDYFSDEELKEQLFELITMEEDDSSPNTNENQKEKAEECLQARYEILTDTIFSETNTDTLHTPDDIPLSNEVLEFAGKTELYLGLGRNSTHDRLALQSVLSGLTNPQEEDENKAEKIKKRIAAVKQIVVYVPCKILYGGKEILEMPGTDDSDPIAMDFIRGALSEVDAVILLTENGFKICEKEVKDALSESNFLQRCVDDPENNQLLLLTYPEKNLKWKFGICDISEIQKLENEEKKKRDKELKAVRKILKRDSLSMVPEERIFTSYILPVLHTSILAQKGTEYEVITDNHNFLKHTGIKSLIIQLDKFVLSRQRSTFEEVKSQLSHFHKEINGEISMEDARTIVQTLSNKRTTTYPSTPAGGGRGGGRPSQQPSQPANTQEPGGGQYHLSKCTTTCPSTPAGGGGSLPSQAPSGPPSGPPSQPSGPPSLPSPRSQEEDL